MNARPVFLAAILLVGAAAWAQAPKSQTAQAPAAEISADMGPCTAEFHVTDLAGKPIYDAKIQTQIRYGFLSLKKLDLELGTDANGRAKFTKLPAQLKRSPLMFKVTYGDNSAEYSYDPVVNCHARYDVPLGKKADEKK